MKIALIPNKTKDKEFEVTKKLVDILKEKATIYMDKAYDSCDFCAIFLDDTMYDEVDAVIVLGGDGTILQVAKQCAMRKIPVMGINLGRIGFMTEVEVCEIKNAVNKLLSGDYIIEERMMMKISIIANEEKIAEYHALNDAVISKQHAEMIAVKLYREEEKINAYMADGVIISTPTGSTGYSLSAGGPVADPTTELFIATPMCAHSLSARSAILASEKKVSLMLSSEGSHNANLTVDGKIMKNITYGEKIEITKAKEKLKLIKMGTQSFYDVLTKKLS